MNVDLINQYFNQYGWNFTQANQQTWVTGFRGDVNSYRILVRSTEYWIHFTISPFVVNSGHPPADVYEKLLQLNGRMNGVKLALDGSRDVILMAECPTENLHYTHFADALNALSHYADLYYLELVNLIHSR